MTRRIIKVNEQPYNVIRSRRRTTVTQKDRRGIVTWHKNKRTTRDNLKESRFRIERNIVRRELAPTAERPGEKEAVAEKAVYRSLIAISYDTPLGRVIDCRVWIHTGKPDVTDTDIEKILRDFLDFLFSVNEAAAMKIEESAIEYDRELSREIEPDEVLPSGAPSGERFGWAELKGSYSYYAQGEPFMRVTAFQVPKSGIETAMVEWFE